VGAQFIDLVFPVQGKMVPVDHGFALYGALSRICPSLHQSEDVSIQRIRGKHCGGGLLSLSSVSRLKLRIPADKIPEYLFLVGKTIDVDGHILRLGVPNPCRLMPKAAVYSHLVTTKNGNNVERFEKEVRNQLACMNIGGKITIGKRRTFKLHDKQIVGYSMLVSELTAEESILLQEKGIGGRRKMGCGQFEGIR
jgi:CRISPR-associated protein Cas6